MKVNHYRIVPHPQMSILLCYRHFAGYGAVTAPLPKGLRQYRGDPIRGVVALDPPFIGLRPVCRVHGRFNPIDGIDALPGDVLSSQSVV